MPKGKKRFNLRNLKIKKVDLVTEGANPDATVNLFKSKEPINKGADTFNDKIKEQSLYRTFDQIWQFTNALSSSLIDILRDDEAVDKANLMNKSLEEFYGAAGLAIEAWSNGKTSDYVINNTAVSEETAEIMKSIAGELAEHLKVAFEKNAQEQVPLAEEGGIKDMKFDKSKLTPEELAQLEEFEKKAGIPEEEIEDEEDKSTEEKEEKNCGGKKKVAKSDNEVENGEGSEDIYKGLHPVVAAELKNLRKFREDQERAQFVSIAKKYEILGKDPEKFADVLKSVKDAGGTAYDDLISTLDASLETVEKSGAFKEIGSNGYVGDGSTAIAKAKAMAAELKKSNPAMTDMQAMAAVWENNPELMDEYDNESEV